MKETRRYDEASKIFRTITLIVDELCKKHSLFFDGTMGLTKRTDAAGKKYYRKEYMRQYVVDLYTTGSNCKFIVSRIRKELPSTEGDYTTFIGKGYRPEGAVKIMMRYHLMKSVDLDIKEAIDAYHEKQRQKNVKKAKR